MERQKLEWLWQCANRLRQKRTAVSYGLDSKQFQSCRPNEQKWYTVDYSLRHYHNKGYQRSAVAGCDCRVAVRQWMDVWMIGWLHGRVLGGTQRSGRRSEAGRNTRTTDTLLWPGQTLRRPTNGRASKAGLASSWLLVQACSLPSDKQLTPSPTSLASSYMFDMLFGPGRQDGSLGPNGYVRTGTTLRYATPNDRPVLPPCPRPDPTARPVLFVKG